MSTPTLTCDDATSTSITLRICGGSPTGAPQGFSIQWELASDLNPDGSWNNNAPSYCSGSFSGVPGCSAYGLPAGQCLAGGVNIGDNLFDNCGASSTCPSAPLAGNTSYAFRAFAHGGTVNGTTYQRSDFTPIVICTTRPCENVCCEGGCTFTQGYWKTHGPVGCQTGNNTNVWPQSVQDNGLTLGGCTYTQDQLCSIFNAQGTAGNGWYALAHQLIAAELNIANGACAPTEVTDAIAQANALMSQTTCYPNNPSLPSSATSDLTNTLDHFNQGDIGPGRCQQ